MQELIEVRNKPAVLDVNFDVLKAALEKELERYAITVTGDTVADAKKLATELNATKKVISERRKAEVAKASEPVKAFDGKMKELEALCEDGRQHILDQVKLFEDETREKARSLLEAKRTELWEQQGVDQEFRRAEYDDLILLTSVTTKGNLAASVRTKLEQRVTEDKSLQDRTKMRLLELENQSYKAGLAAPLTRDHVKPFLFADDATYSAELQRILDAEVNRQEAAERRMREQMERDARAKAEAEQREKERQERLARQEAEVASQDEPAQAVNGQLSDEAVPNQQGALVGYDRGKQEEERAPEPMRPRPDGKIPYTVTAVFHTAVAASVPVEAIEAELRRVMEKAGITTLAKVIVEQAEERAA